MTYAYMRLSTTEEQQATSFDVQREAINTYMKENELALTTEYADTVSGTASIDQRPSMTELFDVLRRGDTVIVHKRDRLARDGMLAGWIQIELKRMGVILVFVENSGGETPADKMMEQILFAFAEFERNQIVARIKASKKLQKSRGEFLGGKPPYGYEIEIRKGTKYLKEAVDEQRAIKLMKKLRESDETYAAISGVLAREGIYTRNGNTFAPMQIQRSLSYAKSLQ